MLVKELQVLHDLGLTFTQAKVYLVLCKYGTLETKQIAKLASISRPDVYRIIDDLECMGLVERTLSKPVRYKVFSYDQRILSLFEKKRSNISKLESDVHSLLEKLEKQKKIQIKSNNYETTFVPGKEPLMLKINKIITESKESLCCLGSHKKICVGLFSFSKELIQAINRGVKLQIVTDKNQDSKLIPDTLQENATIKQPSLGIRYVKNLLSTHILVKDKKQVLINTSTITGFAKSPAVWSNNPSIVSLGQNYFDIIWLIASKESQQKIDLVRCK